MKFAKIYIKIFFGILLLFTLLFTLIYGRYKITNSQTLGKTENYKGILTLWQIDSFEGGTGSRKQFLLKTARSFEKKNPGVLVMVIEHSKQSMLEEIKKENCPDLISFGLGVELNNVTNLNMQGDKGGTIGEKTYAVSWCRGGYVLIANPKLVNEIGDDINELLVSQGEYTQPLVALYLEGINVGKITVKKPMDAYVEFVTGKTPYFLATQRDIIRLERRQMEVLSRPLEKYNDLYQYISITSNDDIKSEYSKKFIEHLLSESVQKSLSELSLFSNRLKVEYNNEHLKNLQELNNFSTISAFTSDKILKEMQENSLLLLKGEKELEIKIKNMLI